jgi:DNA-binding phage protein
MAKVSIDVDGLKKSLRSTAYTAKAQLKEIAKRAQSDLNQKEVLKKIDQIFEMVKANEFIKNRRVAEIAKKVRILSEQLEKAVTKNAGPFVDQLKATVKGYPFGKPKKKTRKRKKATSSPQQGSRSDS